jgi:hypothetical protein
MNSPISSGDFDPLLPPGGGIKTTAGQAGFKAGDHVRASMDGTAFFKRLPKGDADADKTLIRNTNMKVIRVSGSYLQVELDNTGEVGYVPAVMVENPNAQPPALPLSPDAIPVYPPLPGPGNGTPLPSVDPTGVPPEGAIPTVIDPEAPSALPPSSVPPTAVDPVPPINPTLEAPAQPKPKSTTPAPPKPKASTPEPHVVD